MTRALSQVEEAAQIATQAKALTALAERIVATGDVVIPQGRRTELQHIADTLAESRRVLERAAEEAETARTILNLSNAQREVLALVARGNPTPDEIARANAALLQPISPAVMAELMRQGAERRVAATALARDLLAEQPELSHLAQKQPEAVQRSLEILALKLPDRDAMLSWLNTEQPDLDMQTPLQVMRQGYGDAVERMLENALYGIPS